MVKLTLAMLSFALLLVSCATQPAPSFQSAPPPNPNAPIAYLGEGSASMEMQREYAAALQNAGLYNFITEVFSEEQIDKPVEIRLNYKEEHGKLNRIPVLVMEAEFKKHGVTSYKVVLKETNNKILFSPLHKNKEKKFSQYVLMTRFVEEVKRVAPQSEVQDSLSKDASASAEVSTEASATTSEVQANQEKDAGASTGESTSEVQDKQEKDASKGENEG